jgi:transcriptional regulator GlxA family with amidase domain
MVSNERRSGAMKGLFLALLVAGLTLRAAKANEAALVPPRSGAIKVAFVLSERATVIDFAGPWEVFQDTDASIPFELFTVAPSRMPVHTSGGHGMTVTPDYAFEDAPSPDLVVIGAQSGGPGLSDWLQKIHRDGAVILSVCTGAFKVAQAGLLNGRAATTHHDYLDKFAQEFPTVRVVHSARYVRSDPLIYTAGGLTSGVDLALHVVDSYFGRTVAQKTADYMEYQSDAWKKP